MAASTHTEKTVTFAQEELEKVMSWMMTIQSA